MKMFEKEATQHWRRSRDFFYRPVVRCPALLLFSATDPIGNPQSYAKVRASYEDMGIQVSFYIFFILPCIFFSVFPEILLR